MISNHILEAGWTGEAVECPAAVSDDQIVVLSVFIVRGFAERPPASYSDIAFHMSAEFGLDLPIDTLRHIRGVPMDGRRLKCDVAEIDKSYNTFEALLDDLPAALLIKVDETGHQDLGGRAARNDRRHQALRECYNQNPYSQTEKTGDRAANHW
jgi:hypothetical protein